MAQRRQRGWLKKETRIQGETWVLYFRTTRKFDGRRVENKIPIGFVRDFPDKSSAWAEVERLHLALNPVDSRQGVTFADLAQHYAEHELVDRSESILGEPLKCVLILSTSFLGMSTRNSSGTLLFGRTRGAILALLSVNCWIPLKIVVYLIS